MLKYLMGTFSHIGRPILFIHKMVGTTGAGALGHNRLEQGVEMRCWDGKCVYDIVLNAHFIKKD